MSEQETPASPETESSSAATLAAPEKMEEGKLQQEVEIKDIGPCRKHIKVTVNRADINTRVDEHYDKLMTKEPAWVPGFRPGKAPRRLVEQRFKKDVFEQVRAEVLMASLEQIAEDHDVAPLAPPDIDPARIEIPNEGPMVYEFDVEVRPQFDLPQYKGIKLKRPVMEFNDQDIQREERRLLEPYGTIAPKGDDAAVAVGDFVTVDMTAKHGDKVLNQAKDVQLRVDSRLALRDGVAEKFGEQMTGAKRGDTRTIDIVLSDTAADPELRGKTVQGIFHVNEVKELRLPEMDADLLDRFGVGTPEAFREKVRVVLNRRLQYQQERSYREQILSLIAESATWDLPQDLLRRHARRAFSRRVMEMRNAGMSDQEIAAQQRLLERDVLRSTELSLKEHFVLQKIAEVEKIEIEDADIDEEVVRIAEANDESPRRLRARLEREDLMEALAIELIERRALDLILQNAEYEDVKLTPTKEDSTVSTAEVQTVQGEMADPMAAPLPEAKHETAEEPKP